MINDNCHEVDWNHILKLADIPGMTYDIWHGINHMESNTPYSRWCTINFDNIK